MLRIIGCALVERAGLARITDLGEEQIGKIVDPRQPSGRVRRQPVTHHVGRVDRLGRAPGGLGSHATVHGRTIERVIRAKRSDVGRITAVFGQQTDQPIDPRAQWRRPCARSEPQIARAGAAHQETLDLVLRHPQAQHFERLEQRRIALLLGFGQHVGQHAPRQQIAIAVFHRTRARGQPRLDREGRQQPLRERMDRADAQAAARAIEYRGKAAARAQPCRFILRRADEAQFLEQLDFGQPHPARQHVADPRGHFGGARLGESQAQDLLGLDPRFEQQAQHARGEHLRLAGARRGRQPHRAVGRHRKGLVVLQRKHRTHAEGLPLSGRTARPCHSSSRIN